MQGIKNAASNLVSGYFKKEHSYYPPELYSLCLNHLQPYFTANVFSRSTDGKAASLTTSGLSLVPIYTHFFHIEAFHIIVEPPFAVCTSGQITFRSCCSTAV